ncbi:MAG: isopentenyl-diphosphate Delta-isomerase [Gammaproteobacteria bacterium]|nr:isopentenyl-diphosphate Delta-isomerase [Gammaproteobacteria bacterium]
MIKTNEIVLVDTSGNQTGTMEKMEAHRSGRLHRAFSIFIINSQGDLLLQQRSGTKYHSCGLWSNTCCSHPAPGETLFQAAHRRLREELDFDCELREIFSFTYRAEVGNGLIEHELDHVLLGVYDGAFQPSPDEIQACKWTSITELIDEISVNGEAYTEWLKLVIELKLPELLRGVERLQNSAVQDALAAQ